jgi:nitrilase
MTSDADVEANLRLMDRLVDAAANDGCGLIALPENFALMPKRARDKTAHAEQPGGGPIQERLAAAAKRSGSWIVGGSLPLVSPEPDRVYGACPVYAPDGEQKACYRKIHLFDVKLPNAGESYQESWSMFPGDEPVVVDTPAGALGLTICYDIRFPELYRQLVDMGATLFTVPAAFTVPTGKAHWHTLLRARAIENLAYVIAPGQYGCHPDNRVTFGHSLIVDPWGQILAEAEAENCFIVADIDPELPTRLREDFPALANRKL